MPASREQIVEFLTSDKWGPGEKFIIKWQFRYFDDEFYELLAKAIAAADPQNRARLERGFPVEVAGYHMWAYGDLAERLRAAGLNI